MRDIDAQRPARVLGTAVPHAQVWLLPRGSTFTSTRPALAALYDTLVHWFNQDWTAILRTPMIFEAEYGTVHFCRTDHQQEYTKRTGLGKQKAKTFRINQKKTAAFPCRLKGDSPLRQNLWG
jgi:hypothetical protein